MQFPFQEIMYIQNIPWEKIHNFVFDFGIMISYNYWSLDDGSVLSRPVWRSAAIKSK